MGCRRSKADCIQQGPAANSHDVTVPAYAMPLDVSVDFIQAPRVVFQGFPSFQKVDAPQVQVFMVKIEIRLDVTRQIRVAGSHRFIDIKQGFLSRPAFLGAGQIPKERISPP